MCSYIIEMLINNYFHHKNLILQDVYKLLNGDKLNNEKKT